MKDIRVELEDYTSKLISGDITPVVFDLLKDSPDKKELFKYLQICVEEAEQAEVKKLEPIPSLASLISSSKVIV